MYQERRMLASLAYNISWYTVLVILTGCRVQRGIPVTQGGSNKEPSVPVIICIDDIVLFVHHII